MYFLCTTFVSLHQKWCMRIPDLITFDVMDVVIIADVEEKYVIVVEFFTNIHDRLYLVKLPTLHHKLEKRLVHYKNIIN